MSAPPSEPALEPTDPTGDDETRTARHLHASAVALGPRGLLILGAAGAGKTTLALALVALGAELVADDRVLVSPQPGSTAAAMSAPEGLAGLVEIRGAGILPHPHRAGAPLWLAADLDAAPAGRMPPRRQLALCGTTVPLLAARALPPAALLAILRTGALPDPECPPARSEAQGPVTLVAAPGAVAYAPGVALGADGRRLPHAG